MRHLDEPGLTDCAGSVAADRSLRPVVIARSLARVDRGRVGRDVSRFSIQSPVLVLLGRELYGTGNRLLAGCLLCTSVDPDYVETQPTTTPYFDCAEPHPSSPAGQVRMWGTLARRVGAAKLRAAIIVGLFVVLILLLIETTR